MALFSSSPGSSQLGNGKFGATRRQGVRTEERHDSGDYHFDLLSVQSTIGSSERKRFHVRIETGRGYRVAYLRDFSSARQAIEAAREWIAERENCVTVHGIQGRKNHESRE